ncbi:MAG: Asp-tRNA(Asn)/Glu-tRNA(Gln) amidotransferase subunit GatA [Myxococcales bacterium]|nr:Asp-tRNA(Asn)/Glu-tRNA(Gln) amidotransferase subunit GatA [Myxococcales bacterium]
MSLTERTLTQVTLALGRGEASSVEVTRACLERITRVDKALGAFLSLDEARALDAAKESDERRAKQQGRGPLDGVPVALKDNILTRGHVTTAGSKILAGFVPPYDACVTARLREAGAVVLGKCNLDEFAMGSSTENSAFQPTHNPYARGRTPGGSSGGSAAAVAARLVFGALGSDTGGSIRQPAALCNVVGLKPTWGRVSRRGVVAFASSLDQVGPLARTVEDAAALLQVIAGRDPLDATSSDEPVPDFSASLTAGVKGLRIGLPVEYQVEGLDPEVASAIDEAARRFEALGATVTQVSLPHTKYALAAYYVIAPSEASSNLARYDGVRFGHRAKQVKSLADLYEKSRSEGFGPEVKRRIMLGTFALSAGYHEAYYVKAQQVRTLIRRDFEQAFEKVDLVLSATSPVPAWRLGEKVDDPLKMYLMDVLTLPCSLAGLPGVSVPAGFTKAGLPVGLQVMGRPFDEVTVLQAAAAFERETKHFERGPAP